MDKNNYPVVPIALLLTAVSGTVCADGLARKPSPKQEVAVVVVEYLNLAPYRSMKIANSDCQRNRVVWSGGVARRGPDRISPRPVRSRWQGDAETRIYCTGGNPFSQKRVADTPWLR